MPHLISLDNSKIIQPDRLYMRFPDKLIVQLCAKSDKNPLPNRGVFLSFQSPTKIQYSIGPALTDERGEVIFVDTEVQAGLNQCLVDQESGRGKQQEECLSYFSIRLPSAQDLQKLKNMNLLNNNKASNDTHDLNSLAHAKNDNSSMQEWYFNAEELISESGTATIECIVDGI